jgi:hypothetical protein
MNSKLSLSLFMIFYMINNVMSANNPCLNFTDWMNFKSNFSSRIIRVINPEAYNPYKIQFNDIKHETKAYKILFI